MKKNRKKNKLLLINPWVYDFTAYDFWSKPLGLLYLAAILRKEGYNIDYIDCMDRNESESVKFSQFPFGNHDGRGAFQKEKIPKPESLKQIPRNYCRYGIKETEFEKKISNSSKPDAVLITSIMTYWYPGVFKVIELVKKYYPACPVILGGIYATLCYQHALNFSKADYILPNSHLNQLLPLLKNITAKPVETGEDEFELQSLNSYPYPAWDLYPRLDYICLITSRGCPYRCTYCASSIINPHLEFRDPLKVVDEIVYWKELKKVHNFVFYDDALLVKPDQHFILLLKEVKKRSLKISFHTPNALHAGLIDQQMAKLMIESGFENIWLGFETADPVLQKNTGGKIDNDSFIKTIRILLKEGFPANKIRVYLLIGLPGQSLQSIIDSAKLVMDNGIKPYLAKYSPIPGTKMWSEIIKEYGWEEPIDPLWHNDALMPYFSPYINSEQYQLIKELIQSFNP